MPQDLTSKLSCVQMEPCLVPTQPLWKTPFVTITNFKEKASVQSPNLNSRQIRLLLSRQRALYHSLQLSNSVSPKTTIRCLLRESKLKVRLVQTPPSKYKPQLILWSCKRKFSARSNQTSICNKAQVTM